MKQRRTKIIATICESVSSVEHIKSYIKSGMDIIRVNMAYCNQKVNHFPYFHEKTFSGFGDYYEK